MNVPPREAIVAFTCDELIFNQGENFWISFSSDIESIAENVYLVIDIYDHSNPVHPDGHLGYWQFDIALFNSDKNELQGVIVKKDNGAYEVNIDNTIPVSGWFNFGLDYFSHLVVMAVLRSKKSNEMVWFDTILGARNYQDIKGLRDKFSRDWQAPSYAPPEKTIKQQGTIRIYSRNIYPRDAVGNFCLEISRLLKQYGINVQLYAENFELCFNDIIRPIKRLRFDIKPTDQLFYFFSTFDPYLTMLNELPFNERYVYYHGVTTPSFFDEFDSEMADVCHRAYLQLIELATFDKFAANSEINAQVLKQHIYDVKSDKNYPVMIIPPKLLYEPNMQAQVLDKKVSHHELELLYVGRIKSHKKIEDLFYLLRELKKLSPKVRLTIIGAGADQKYKDFLQGCQQKNSINSQDVEWLGSVSDDELQKAYLRASIYVSMSEDEGFCLPILEAMTTGVPVFAYDLPAVREVTAGTVMLFQEKNFSYLAREIYTLCSNSFSYEEKVKQQYEQAKVVMKNMDGKLIWQFLTAI